MKKPQNPWKPMQIINSAGIISLVMGLVCGFKPEVMSSMFILFLINLMMGAIIFGQGGSGGDK